MNVAYYYRTKGISFSIERVFAEIRKFMPLEVTQSEFYCALNNYKNPYTYIKNIIDAKRLEADVNHITGVVHYIALGLNPEHTLITVHDLDFLNKRKGFNKFLYKKIFFDFPLKRVRKIVAISEFTKKQLMEIGVPKEKIRVIGDPAPSSFKYTKKEFNEEMPVLLAFCHIHTKNFTRLAKAISGVKCHLRVIGKLNDFDKKILEQEQANYSNAFNLSDEEIIQEYIKCDALLFPSIYEGFGVPVLEAQLTGRPVITTHAASLKDVARDSAKIVNPFEISSIRTGIIDVLSSATLREELIEKGLNNAQRFAPESIAKKYLDVYKEIC